jgi:nucleoside-diphosphate-sugar epimerase
MKRQTIIGGNGTIGKMVAAELHKMNIPVRIASRNPKPVNQDDEIFTMDVLNEQSTENSIKGSSVVYLILGLPYKSKIWLNEFPKAVENVIKACKKEGAKLVYFDNVYMYGFVDGWMNETTPNRPSSVKGKARQIAADLILDAVKKMEIDAMICRSADFYGDYPAFDVIKQIAEKLKKGKSAQLLISADKKHSLTYIPDAAKAVAYLGQQTEAYNQIWHLPTDPNPLIGKELVELVAEVLQVKPRYSVIPKGILNFISIFNSTMKELLKLSYQWEKDYLFSSKKIEETYGLKATTYKNGITEHLIKIGILKK